MPSTIGSEAGLDAIVFNHIFAEEFPGTLFISAGGNDVVSNSILAIRILSKAFDGVTLLRLKDRDEKTDVERQAFLDESPSNRMFSRREIENYLFDKETLRNYASAKMKVFDEGRYDSDVYDILTQDLKLVQQQIQHSVQARGSISEFKKELRFYIPKDGIIYNEIKSCLK